MDRTIEAQGAEEKYLTPDGPAKRVSRGRSRSQNFQVQPSVHGLRREEGHRMQEKDRDVQRGKQSEECKETDVELAGGRREQRHQSLSRELWAHAPTCRTAAAMMETEVWVTPGH